LARGKNKTPSLADYLTVADAAEFLGVSASTLRNWDRQKKLKATRNPLNGYRLYERSALEKLLAEIRSGKTKAGVK